MRRAKLDISQAALPDIQDALAAARAKAENPAQAYLDDLAPSGRRTMASALKMIAAVLSRGSADLANFDWSTLNYPDVLALKMLFEAHDYAPATVAKFLNAIRGVAKQARLRGLIDVAEELNIKSVQARKEQKELSGRVLTLGELGALMAACQPGQAGLRDAAIVVVLGGAGLRRSELVALDVDDYDRASHVVRVRGGKGNKDRRTYLPSWAGALLEAWLDQVAIFGDQAARLEGEPVPMFQPISRSDRLLVGRLTDSGVWDILKRRGAQAGLAPFSCHDLRRSFTTLALQQGGDRSTVRKMLGHATEATIKHYDHRGDEEKQAVADLVPDFRLSE